MRCFLVFIFVVGLCHALPFSKNSGVKELDGKQLASALKTHKPVMLLLYAPWCGHCKAIHPEFEQLGKKSEGVIEVIAVDADKHRDVGGPYGLKGFPTVVYYGVDKKKPFKPYQGERKVGAMLQHAMSLVETAQVTVIKDKDANQLKKVTEAAKYSVILFTEKDKVPPLVSVMAYESAFKGTIPFVAIKKKNAVLADKFNPPQYPSIAVAETVEGELKVKAWFEGKIAYDAIVAFVRAEAGLPVDKKSEGGGDKKNKVAEEAPPKKPAVAKPAVPVTPIEFNEQQMKLYCGDGAPTINEAQPFCTVFFFADKADVSALSSIHATFKNEPFIIMYSTDVSALVKLNFIDKATTPAVVVFKGGKKGVRYTGKSYSSVEELYRESPKLLEKISGGEIKMQKAESFP